MVFTISKDDKDIISFIYTEFYEWDLDWVMVEEPWD
jgi:hypothetical protein